MISGERENVNNMEKNTYTWLSYPDQFSTAPLSPPVTLRPTGSKLPTPPGCWILSIQLYPLPSPSLPQGLALLPGQLSRPAEDRWWWGDRGL